MNINTIPGILLATLMMLASCNNSQQQAGEVKTDAAKVNSDTMQAVTKTILFFGNSLTAGYGLDDPQQAFPSLVQTMVDSLKLPYKTVNAGVSGETSAGGNARVAWVLRQPVDIFVLELGANDGLRGIPVNETRKNLQGILDKVKAAYPNAKLVVAGMQVPPNMGQQYAADFRSVFPALAKNNNALLIPFILEGVGGEASLNQQDGIHPTAEGHRVVARNVWEIISKAIP